MVNPLSDLPILGEPLIAEFANTLYRDSAIRLDVFERPDRIASWFKHAPCATDLDAPRRFTPDDAERLRHLRDAIRQMLSGSAERDLTGSLSIINGAARLGDQHRLLEWQPRRHRLAVVIDSSASPFETLLATIASRFVDMVAAHDIARIRVCDRLECNMYYYRNHHRRRYCNERCANADRQSRYNRRVAAARHN